ncbi:MAG TPA: nuclear transport factor 2 family protein [Candidatus Binataceae bacterium]|nr:nuclear transport factor 2 family protein [Candidatus Binataceae bacterium]
MAQTSSTDRSSEVAEVEEREAQATLGNDVNALDALWSESLVVSSTANLVLSKNQALTLFRGGRIRLKTFERRVSKVAVIDDVALATGNESFTVKEDPTGKDPSPTDLFTCSYMNAWKLERGQWKMIGRHVGLMARLPATVKSPETAG